MPALEKILQLVDFAPLHAGLQVDRVVEQARQHLANVGFVGVVSELRVWSVPHQALDQERRDGISSGNLFLAHLVAKPLEYAHDILESPASRAVLAYAVAVVLVGPIDDAVAVIWNECRACRFDPSPVLS